MVQFGIFGVYYLVSIVIFIISILLSLYFYEIIFSLLIIKVSYYDKIKCKV